jgi:hypothetical protein
MKYDITTMSEDEARALAHSRAKLSCPPLLWNLYWSADYHASKEEMRGHCSSHLVPLSASLHEGVNTADDVACVVSSAELYRAQVNDDALFSNLLLRGLMFVRELRRVRCPIAPQPVIDDVNLSELAWFQLFFSTCLDADPVLGARRAALESRWARYFQDRAGGPSATAFRTSAEYFDTHLRGACYEWARRDSPEGGTPWADITERQIGEMAERVYIRLYRCGDLPFYVSKAAPKAGEDKHHEPRYALRRGVGSAAILGMMWRELGRIVAAHRGGDRRKYGNWWVEIVDADDPVLRFEWSSRARTGADHGGDGDVGQAEDAYVAGRDGMDARLRDPDAATRVGAVIDLSLEVDGRNVPQLISMLHDPDAGVQENAAMGLVPLPTAGVRLRGLLKDTETNVRLWVAAALAWRGSPAAIRTLLEMTGGEAPDERPAWMPRQRFRPQRPPGAWGHIQDFVKATGDWTAFTDLATDEDETVRLSAVLAVGHFELFEAMEPMIDLLAGETNPRVLAAAAELKARFKVG